MSSQASTVPAAQTFEVGSRPGPVATLTRWLLGRLLRRLIRTGSLTVILPNGELHAGDGGGEDVRVRLRDNRTARYDVMKDGSAL